MQNILIIEPNWLGDVLFTTPAIRAIRKAYKGSYISVIVHSRCLPILEDNPNIDHVIAVKGSRGLKGFFEKLALVPKLKAEGFDIAFLFSRSMSAALICASAGIKERIGYHTYKRFFLLTKGLTPPRARIHHVEYFLDISKAAGADTEDKDYGFFIKDKDEKAAGAILAENGIYENEPYFVINPGGNWMPKRWPKTEFAKLSDQLSKTYNIKIVITGADKDIFLGKSIKTLCKVNKPIIICGKTTLKQLAAILKNAKAVISNDSGPMHIAVSQRAPTVALFGPTDPAITGPYGSSRYVVVQKEVECAVPCYSRDCRRNRCMEAITVADVMEAVEKLEHCSQN